LPPDKPTLISILKRNGLFAPPHPKKPSEEGAKTGYIPSEDLVKVAGAAEESIDDLDSKTVGRMQRASRAWMGL